MIGLEFWQRETCAIGTTEIQAWEWKISSICSSGLCQIVPVTASQQTSYGANSLTKVKTAAVLIGQGSSV